MKKLLIRIIRLYQSTPSHLHSLCRFTPTCSEYAVIALNDYGCIKGLYLTIKRILRCNPLGKYGYDPVPKKEKKMKKIRNLIIGMTCAFLLTGCNLFDDNSMKDIDVYTTIYPINYLITYLYGNNATVHSIYPKGVDINTYKLSEKKINEYSKSKLFVFNSLDKDKDYAVKMVNNNKELKLIDVSMGMTITNNIEELWLNPYNYLMMAKNVHDGLNEYIDNPYLLESIDKNYEKFKYDISNLDASLKEIINNANYTTIVTDNDAFKFLEKYGITVISLEDNEELNQNIINEARKLISEGKIKYIYSLKDDSNESVNAIINEFGIELVTINSMNSIDGNITNTNESYLTIMNNNIELISKELEK